MYINTSIYTQLDTSMTRKKDIERQQSKIQKCMCRGVTLSIFNFPEMYLTYFLNIESFHSKKINDIVD